MQLADTDRIVTNMISLDLENVCTSFIQIRKPKSKKISEGRHMAKIRDRVNGWIIGLMFLTLSLTLILMVFCKCNWCKSLTRQT